MFDFVPRFCQRMDEYPLYTRRLSCDSLALAMCDPGLRRCNSSEFEEDSLPEVYMDSGLSTLRGSHGGYDSELEAKCLEADQEEEKEKKEVNGKNGNNDILMEENFNTEV